MIKSFILLTVVFFIAILFIPFSICVNYNNKKLNIIICYLFFKFNIINSKNKKTKAESNKKSQKLNMKKFFFTFSKIIKSSFLILTLIKIILKKVNFQKLYIVLFVSSDKSESCAKNYFYTRTAIYYILKILKLENQIKKFRVRIIPSFLDENVNFKLNLILTVSPFMVLSSIFEFVYIYWSKKNRY